VSKYIIQGREYNSRVVLKASLNIWRRVLLEQGVGMKTVIGDVQSLKSMDDVFEDPKLQKSWMAFVWVLRLASGEDLTFEEANDVPLDEFRIILGDSEEDEAPKAQPASDQDESPAE
jgi:hypothetical protein